MLERMWQCPPPSITGVTGQQLAGAPLTCVSPTSLPSPVHLMLVKQIPDIVLNL